MPKHKKNKSRSRSKSGKKDKKKDKQKGSSSQDKKLGSRRNTKWDTGITQSANNK